MCCAIEETTEHCGPIGRDGECMHCGRQTDLPPDPMPTPEEMAEIAGIVRKLKTRGI